MEGSIELQEEANITFDDNIVEDTTTRTKGTTFDLEDSTSSSSESSQSLLTVLKPNKLDLVPIFLFIAVTLMCIGVSLAVYFPYLEVEKATTQAQFQSLIAVEVQSLKNTISEAKSAIIFTNSLCSITKGVEGLSLDQFSDFVHNNNNRGSYIGDLYYLSNVRNVSTFPSYLEQKDPVGWANFTYKSGEGPSSSSDSCNGTYCIPVTLVSSDVKLVTSRSSLGWNHWSSPARAALIIQSLTNGQGSAISSFLNGRQGSPISSIYVPVMDDRNLYGFVYAELGVQNMVENSLPSLAKYNGSTVGYYSLTIYEGDLTTPNLTVYSSSVASFQQFTRKPYARGSDGITQVLEYGNLLWTCVFVPTKSFNELYDGELKFSGLMAMAVVWIFNVILCIILFVLVRVRSVQKARQLTQRKIVNLSKYEPRDFLRIISKRGKKTKLVFEYVQIEGLHKIDEADVCDAMSSIYSHIKEIANNHAGFVYQSHNNGFLLLFGDAQKAIDAAVGMSTIPRIHDVKIYTSIHHVDSALINLISDHDTHLQSIISTGLNVTESLAYFCSKYAKSIVVSQEVYDLSKKSQRKSMLFIGSVPVLSVKCSSVRAYGLLKEAEHTNVNILMADVQESLFSHDYVKAEELLQQLLKLDPNDFDAYDLLVKTQYKIKASKALSTGWTVPDTLHDDGEMFDAFKAYLTKEHSQENLEMWRDLKEYKLETDYQRRSTLASSILQKYLVDKDMNITDTFKKDLSEQLKENSEKGQNFHNVFLELEVLMADAHKRFKSTTNYINLLCEKLK
ncbi:regulator of G-protein signaling [Acrasis kona]|uniref:Regulator of G-protein signaling n=1 Tax=Acrasis kona TaxID=1008807 RepID=A0AAW2ZIN4_9EUKA